MDDYVPDDVSAEVFQSYKKKNTDYLRKVGDLKWDKAGRDKKGIQKEVFWPKSNWVIDGSNKRNKVFHSTYIQ